jgi:16S rRNA (guanine966-N2)-methyltransferase
MRIIAGTLGGRNFSSPRSHRTHPMSDKVRGALFNTLGDIEGLTVLDTFAGSGALSFEAVSRGAGSALAIENDKPAQQAIEESITILGLSRRVRLVKAGCGNWSDNNPEQQFDIVIADPPYDKLQPSLLNKLTKHLKPGGLYVLSWPGGTTAPDVAGCTLAVQKSYGDAQLLFFRQT